MRITKVYTRTGDAGKTRLADGQEVWKDTLRVEAFGTVDELSSVIGLSRVFNNDLAGNQSHVSKLDKELRWIQNKLFDVGGVLATTSGQELPNMPKVTENDVLHLEQLMDSCQKELAPLEEFLLLGGGKVSGFLHLARTVCRRAERLCVRLAREDAVDPVFLRFLNRLSDGLFVLARWTAKNQGEPEFLWERHP